MENTISYSIFLLASLKSGCLQTSKNIKLYLCFVIDKKINNDKYVANTNQHLKYNKLIP
jgi:hypothetical protein